MVIPVLWLGLLLLSFVSKHNMWWYYGLGCRCCRPSVNTACGRNKVCFLLSSISKHNIWSYYGWVYICRQLVNTHVVVVRFVFRGCRPSVNTICDRIMIGLLLLSSVSKHNMWSRYDWFVVIIRQ